MLLAVIAACEIGFWVLLAAGLVTRYLLRQPKAGLVLLAGVPLVDVVMLVASVIDIRQGSGAVVQALAGRDLHRRQRRASGIRRSSGPTDGRRTVMGGAPRPVKPPKRVPEQARRERPAGSGTCSRTSSASAS